MNEIDKTIEAVWKIESTRLIAATRATRPPDKRLSLGVCPVILAERRRLRA